MREVKFGSFRSFSDGRMILTSYDHGTPEPKTSYIDVPGANGTYDVSTVATSGDIKFNDRTITYTFHVKAHASQWQMYESKIRNAIHGLRVNIYESWDSNRYWTGRISVGNFTANGAGADVTITVQAEPFKYTNITSNDWLWDDFNFDIGVIREYLDINLDGQKTINIVNGRKTSYLTVNIKSFSGSTFYINKGTEQTQITTTGRHVTTIKLTNGSNNVTFGANNAIFSIEYKGGDL